MYQVIRVILFTNIFEIRNEASMIFRSGKLNPMLIPLQLSVPNFICE